MSHPLNKDVLKMKKKCNILAQFNDFGTKIFVMF